MLAYIDRLYIVVKMGENLTSIVAKLVDLFRLENKENYKKKVDEKRNMEYIHYS